MRLKTKVAIFMAAVLITFFGFSLIASSSVDMIKVGKEAGYGFISNISAKADTAAHYTNLIKG
ncbi:MAG: hypothetical protein JSV96_16485 [Candidatus Aminicenantes bacterium]|nr:MAG: hypothetical protein JSV96_16485 [Candidatus Aminicenantes bacterium]